MEEMQKAASMASTLVLICSNLAQLCQSCKMFQDINTFSKILRIPFNKDTGIISKGFRAGFFLGISDSLNVLGVIDFN